MSVSARADASDAEQRPASVSVPELVEVVIASLETKADMAPASLDRFFGLMRRFAAFVSGAHGIPSLDEVETDHLSRFLEARTPSGLAPSVATIHLRRSAIRLLFREAGRIGAVRDDPTTNLDVPPRSSLPFRPLNDDEVALCRSFARRDMSGTREPAAWALSEASARCSELPFIRAGDIDVVEGSVFIAGGAKTASRYGELSDWGLVQVKRRLRALTAKDPQALLLGAATRNRASARASAYDAIRTTLDRAGLSHEPDVRPNSLVAWRGASALASGASIDEVARMLGIRSLDAAASFIGWDWQGEAP
jgi:site-specific recombinase XerD